MIFSNKTYSKNIGKKYCEMEMDSIYFTITSNIFLKIKLNHFHAKKYSKTSIFTIHTHNKTKLKQTFLQHFDNQNHIFLPTVPTRSSIM